MEKKEKKANFEVTPQKASKQNTIGSNKYSNYNNSEVTNLPGYENAVYGSYYR